MDGEGLPPNKRPFFISLPVDRDLDSQEFKEYIKEAYIQDLNQLYKSKFDEKKYVLFTIRLESYSKIMLSFFF